MRPIDSAYDTACAEHRADDPGERRYALVSDHNGPCSLVRRYPSLDAAIAAARTMNTDDAPTDLESELEVNARDSTAWLIKVAEAWGWQVVASASAGEYWTVLVAPD